jgi:2-(3-amino-3-carboxypropyl)histidine synthase
MSAPETAPRPSTYEGEPVARPTGPLFESYDLDLDAVAEKINARPDTSVVGLQLPDGLRDYATEIEKHLRARTGDVLYVISADPSYGACDLALNLQRLGVDLLVHFGHTEMPSINHLFNWDVLYVAARHKLDVRAASALGARKLAERVGARDGQGAPLRVGIVTTAQHVHKLQDMADAMKAEGFEVFVGRGDNRLGGAAQLLGCNYTAGTSIEDDVDGFVYVGSGDFHPIAIAWGTNKPVVLADPYTNEVRTIDDVMDRLMRQRHAAITRAQDAKTFGILVGTRVGQERMRLAKGLKKLLEQKGKEAHLIALDFFSWDNLQYFRHLDALVNTSCPRITTDDYARYPMPMLTPPELEVVLGRRTWEEYAFDEFKGTAPAPKDRILRL